MPFLFSAPNNEIITDPIGIHFYSDLCEELLDWSFTLSTTRGASYDLVTVYLFYTVSFFPSIHSFNVTSCENMVSGLFYLFSRSPMEILTLTGINTGLYTTLPDTSSCMYYSPSFIFKIFQLLLWNVCMFCS